MNRKWKKKILITLKYLALIVLAGILLYRLGNPFKENHHSINTTVAVVSPEIPSTSSELNEVSETSKSLPSGVIIFNEDSYNTYSSEDEALKPENVISLPGEIVCGSKVTGVPGENTQRIRFWIDYISNRETDRFTGFEKHLFPDNNWTVTDVDFRDYAGETIVIAISSSTGDLIPKSTYNYVAFEIPSDPMKAQEESETTSTSEETSTEAETETHTAEAEIVETETESVSESESETSKNPSDELGIGPGFEL